MVEKITVHIQRGKYWQVRSSCTSSPERGIHPFCLNTSMTTLILISMQVILQENYPFLRQKICLMALIESVFKRHASDRTMSFQTIAEETRLPINEVEHLVMKALR